MGGRQGGGREGHVQHDSRQGDGSKEDSPKIERVLYVGFEVQPLGRMTPARKDICTKLLKMEASDRVKIKLVKKRFWGHKRAVNQTAYRLA